MATLSPSPTPTPTSAILETAQTPETNTFTVDMTLASLRKNIDRLKTIVKSPQSTSTTTTMYRGRGRGGYQSSVAEIEITGLTSVSELFRFASSADEARAMLDANTKRAHEDLAKTLTLSRELAKMKDVLYANNSKFGLDSILTDISQLEHEHRILESVVEQLQPHYSQTLLDSLFQEKANEDKLAIQNKVKSTYHSASQIQLFSVPDLKHRLNEIKCQLNLLEEKRNAKNWSHKVTVTLSKATMEALGLTTGSN